MKEINLKKAVAAFRECEDAKRRLKQANDLLAMSMGKVYETRSREDRDKFQSKADEACAAYNVAAKEALASALDAIQKRTTARNISVTDVIESLCYVEDKLNITKKAMDGISVVIDKNAQDFPRAYKYTPESTQFSAYYKNGSWRITSIERETVKRPELRYSVTHTDQSREALLKNYTYFS